MDRLTRPADWPCGCHGWGWRAHTGHCCVTSLFRDTDEPLCHMDLWDEHMRRGGTANGTTEAVNAAIRAITTSLYPGFTPAHDGGTAVGDLVPTGALPPLPDDEYGTPTLPFGETP